MSRISVVVPVYRSRGTVAELVERTLPVIQECGGGELILVNDGSDDGSWEAIRALAADHPEVRGITFLRNYGQHNAVLCGIRAAREEVVVTMDDDLQHPPEEVPRLLEELDRGFDVVYGTPRRQEHSLWRTLAAWAIKLALQTVMGAETARKVSAFRAIRTRVRDGFASYSGPFISVDVLLTWGTSRFSSVTVEHAPRQSGESNYSVTRLISHAANMMTGFSTVPLQLASVIGFVFTIFGVLILVYVVGRYLIEGGSVPGFPFLASIIAIFSGAQLFALGIIGEYLARMHFRLMDRPPYVVAASTEGLDGSASALPGAAGDECGPR